MARLRYNGLSATLGAPLAAADTTVTFAAALTSSAGAVPTLSGGDTICLSILNAGGGVVEIVSLTAYTSGALTGTITRAQESTTAADHASGATVVHSATVADFTGSGSAGRTLLQAVVLSAAAATIDFASIPTSGYRHLEIWFAGRSTKAAIDQDVYLYANGDTTPANYNAQRLHATGATAGATSIANGALGYIPGASAAAGYAGQVKIEIPNYLDASYFQTAKAESWTPNEPYLTYGGWNWKNAAAITALSLSVAPSGGTFAAGAIAQLYGLV